MESVRLSDYRTPVRTDLYRMRAYRDCLDCTIPGQISSLQLVGQQRGTMCLRRVE
jgi:hypothetical protein